MKHDRTIFILSMMVFILAAVAASFGVFSTGGNGPVNITSFRGEQVTLDGRGLYRYDTVSSAIQERAADQVTLLLGLPLLVVGNILTLRKSLRGRFLLTGTLGYFLYTYMSMSFLTSFNPLFLLYVALFSLSLYAFILSMMSYDLEDLPNHFSDRLPRGWIAGLLIGAGSFLLVAWTGRIMQPLLMNQIPALENTTTMVIQAMDLGLIVPLSFFAGILLLRRSVWGSMLATIAVMKFLTMGTCVSVMAIQMAAGGVPVNGVEMGIFLAITLINFGMGVVLLKNIDDKQTIPQLVNTTVQ